MSGSTVVRVLVDEPAIDREFDYLAPEPLPVGTIVRVPLHGRRVRGWVTGSGGVAPPGVTLKPIARVTGAGPPPEVVELAGWAAWRWAGRRVHLLRTASPDRVVPVAPAAPTWARPAVPDGAVHAAGDAGALFTGAGAVVRVAPATDPFALVAEAARRGDALVVVPSLARADRLARRLVAGGVRDVSVLPGAWASAARGGVVVGTRVAAWAPVPPPGAVLVLDEHDERLQQEQAPTWHARDVVAERARRAGAPCVLVSPCPTLEALAWAEQRGAAVVEPPRGDERAGWPMVDVVDRRAEDPRSGLWSERLVGLARDRDRGRVVCVLNRRGRSRLLACAACGELARCERPECGGPMAQPEPGVLACRRCGATRPVVCAACGGARQKNLRIGVSRAREELEALLREPVAEVTAGPGTGRAPIPATRVLVGTEAVLHRVPASGLGVIAFLDFDQELLAPRYRAGEQALGLLARAGRLLGGRAAGGRLVVQTRLPGHAVVRAALHGDPAVVAAEERARRAEVRFPPFGALAALSGPGAAALGAALAARSDVEVLGPDDGRLLVRAPDHGVLCGALAATPRPGPRVRVEVDPLRV